MLGISLGGHAAWHCIFHEPRITTGIVIIGSPDYTRLMSDRARKSKLKTYIESSPQGSSFLGSVDFPASLVEAIEKYDPAGLCLGAAPRPEVAYDQDPSPEQQRNLRLLLQNCLQSKRIINLSGGADKLVPYAQGEPFLRWLKRAISPQGWFRAGNVTLEDIVFDGDGHEMSSEMLEEALRFIEQSLDPESRSIEASSKI